MLMDLIVASVRPIFGGADYSKGHLSLVTESFTVRPIPNKNIVPPLFQGLTVFMHITGHSSRQR
jgi:hypothetical protein